MTIRLALWQNAATERYRAMAYFSEHSVIAAGTSLAQLFYAIEQTLDSEFGVNGWECRTVAWLGRIEVELLTPRDVVERWENAA